MPRNLSSYVLRWFSRPCPKCRDDRVNSRVESGRARMLRRRMRAIFQEEIEKLFADLGTNEGDECP